MPSSKQALVAIDREGARRVWHFGELIAMSASLSGAFAARGVSRGDVVMTLIGNRVEWVLAMLACWRIGAVALPCNTQLRRHYLELRTGATNPALCVGEEECLGGASRRGARDDDGRSGGSPRRGPAQEPPVAIVDLAPEDPALIVCTSGTTGEPRAVLHSHARRWTSRSRSA